jgi:hypothetical protein
VIQQSLFFRYLGNVACHPNTRIVFVDHRQRFNVYVLEELGTRAFTDAQQFQLGIAILVGTQQPGLSLFFSFHIHVAVSIFKVWKQFIVQGHFATVVPSVFICFIQSFRKLFSCYAESLRTLAMNCTIFWVAMLIALLNDWIIIY